jgi:Xaa-Pro aminopeptidase
MKLAEIQAELRRQGIEGWLFFDHHERDPLAYRMLGFSPPQTPTRRWYYWIPAHGEPCGLVHRIEREMLDALPGEKVAYSSWQEQVNGVAGLVRGARRVAMQYSPQCAIPYVSMVDAGTVELVRSVGAGVVSSAELVQFFEARWDEDALRSHLEAGELVDRIRRKTFEAIGERTRNGVAVQELEIKDIILGLFRESGLITDHGPIVAVNGNAGHPHYEPAPGRTSPIRRGDFVLLDMWAKFDRPDAVYYDITWTGFCGDAPPEAIRNVFAIVRDARDAAVHLVRDAAAHGKPLRGYEVDDAARGFIEARGFGPNFTHRTGHSIGRDVHGNGANMDNLETHDERPIVPWTCFSVEPGIYLQDFGVRSEVNVFVGDTDARVTGETQTDLVLL